MKWATFFDGSTDASEFVLRKLGAFVVRLLLFGSLFLMHNCERCSCDIVRPTAMSPETSLGAAPQPAAITSPRPVDLPFMF